MITKKTELWEQVIPFLDRLLSQDQFSVEELRFLQQRLFVINRQSDWFLKEINRSLDCAYLI